MSSEDLPQKDNEPNKGTKTAQDDWLTRLTRLFSLLAAIAATVFFLAAFITLLITWLGFGISPFEEPAWVEQSNSLADHHVEVGNTFLKADEPEAAKEEFDRALKLVPNHREAQLGAFKAKLFLDITEGEPATTSTSIAEWEITKKRLFLLLEEHPNDADLWAYRASISPTPKTALDRFQKATELDHTHAFAYSGKADVYEAQGKLDLYVKAKKRAYELAPWKSIYVNNFANALSKKEQYEDAIAVYEDLRYSDPQYLWAYSDLAGLYRITGNLQTAHSYGKEFIERSQDEEIRSLNRDELARFFTGPNSDPVVITADSEKRYYGYYDIALTSYLLGHTEEAESYVNKAKDIQIDPYRASEIKRVLESDIEQLQEEQEQFRAKAEDFRMKLL